MLKITQSILKLYYYAKREGAKGVLHRCSTMLYHSEITYDMWKKKHRISKKTLEHQRKESTTWDFSIDVVCLFRGSRANLEKSLSGQSAAITKICDDYRTGKGEYILLVGSNVIFYKNAVYEFAQNAQKNPDIDIFYCDHDIEGKNPIFKPDFNRDLQLSSGYIGNVMMVRRNLVETAGVPDGLLQNTNFFDMILKYMENTDKFGHIATILYRDSIGKNFHKDEEMIKALKGYLERSNTKAAVNVGMVEGTYHIKYQVRSQDKISIVIPNRDHRKDLEKCICSIQKQSYKNIEIIIVENHSTTAEIFDFYEKLKASFNNVKVIQWEKTFNYAAVNNYAVNAASGQYYLFLNNDIEFISEDALEEMLGLCQRKGTGAVGIKLFYPDGSIQHAGVIIGYGGIAGHAFLGCDGESHGYMNRVDCVQNYNAVTAACMMVKKEAYDACGGFDERFQIAFNDIDFCLNMRGKGYDIVYTPYAIAWHFESKSRGAEDTCKKMQRFNSEVDLFRSKWINIIKSGDSAYNPNLTLDAWNFTIKR